MNSTLYHQLTNLPLLQGIGGEDLARIEDAVILEPDEFPAMEHPLIRQGEPCTSLLFLVQGAVCCHTQSNDETFSVEEIIEAPHVLEPESLYSLSAKYHSSYTTLCHSAFLRINKQTVGRMLQMIPIFRMNYMLHLSALCERSQAERWIMPEKELEERIMNFIIQHQRSHNSKVVLHIKMATLAQWLHETRLRVSKALRALEEKGCLQLGRGTIRLT